MSPPKTEYTRLTRNVAGLSSYSSLWLGTDHLMIVQSTGYQESYARLQLIDIKGIFLTGTKRRVWWTCTWGIITGLSLIALISTVRGEQSPPYFSLLFSVLGGIGLIWNHVIGAGCRAHVVTGVQTAELPALVRIKKTRQVIARLQPLINAIQANVVVAPPMPAAGAPENTATIADTPTARPVAPGWQGEPELPPPPPELKPPAAP
jgi:hypothetical protein